MYRYMKNMLVSMWAETGESQQKSLTDQVIVTLYKYSNLLSICLSVKYRSQSVLCKAQMKHTEFAPSFLQVQVHKSIHYKYVKTNQTKSPRQADKTIWGESTKNHHTDAGQGAEQHSQQTCAFTTAGGASLLTLVPAPHRLEEEYSQKLSLDCH